jgi:hypothetical protein
MSIAAVPVISAAPQGRALFAKRWNWVSSTRVEELG